MSIGASGSSVFVSGSIDATDPQWARPSAVCTSTTPADHYYDQFTITNTTGAAQTLTITAAWSGDGYLHVFNDPFIALTPTINCISGDDDFGSTAGSQLTGVTIAAGQTLHIVASTFSGAVAIGAYSIEIATD